LSRDIGHAVRRGGLEEHAMPLARLALLAAVGAHAGIYPDGHFDYVQKCTKDNTDAFVKEALDAGKTAFVRWIASEG